MNFHHSYREHVALLLLLAVVSVALFSNTFSNDFLWDDEDLIVNNTHLRTLRNIPAFFTLDYWNHLHPGTPGLYRPVTTTSFAVDRLIWGMDVRGYHATNLLLHSLNVILVYLVAVQLLRASAPPRDPVQDTKTASPAFLGIPFLTALWFASHPIHTESVTWIKNRSDLLALLFFLPSVSCFLLSLTHPARRARVAWYAGSLLCFALAASSKETALSLPFVLLLCTWCFLPEHRNRRTVASMIPFFAVTALLLLRKFTASTVPALPGFCPEMSIYAHALLVVKTVGYYLRLLVLPFPLNAERRLSIPLSPLEPAVLCSVAALVLLAYAIVRWLRSGRTLPACSVLWILLTILPASNIVLLTGRPIAEQRLYVPSLGFCLLLAMGINRIPRRKLALAASALLLAAYSVTTFTRNRDWRDSLTFWSVTLRSSPHSARAHNNLGKAYSDARDAARAIELYREAVRLDPKFGEAYYNLGVEYGNAGRLQEAAASYASAIAATPHYPNPYYNLANLYLDAGKAADAVPLLEKALELAPRQADACSNLGAAYQALGRNDRAEALYLRAIDMQPGNARALVNLGLLRLRLGEKEKALTLFMRATELEPDYPEAWSNLGLAHQALGRTEKALSSYERAVEVDPGYADGYYNIGVLHVQSGKSEEGIAMFQKAVEANLRHVHALFNLGILYRKMKKTDEAIDMFRRVMEIRPAADACNNLAMLYFGKKQYDLAAKYCDRAATLGIINRQLLDALKPYRKKK